MRKNSRRLISLVLLLGQLGLGPLMEISHTDELVLSGGAKASVASHNRGSQENHIPPAATGFCVACALSFNRNATQTSVLAGASLPCNLPISLSSEPSFITQPHIFATGMRGPPAA